MNVKALAQKKIGPLPAWSVAAVLGGSVIVFLIRRRSGGASSSGLTDVGFAGGGFPESGPGASSADVPTVSQPTPTVPAATPAPSITPSATVAKTPIITRASRPTINTPNAWGAQPVDTSKYEIVNTASGPAYKIPHPGGAVGYIPTDAVLATLPGSGDTPISLSNYAVEKLGLTRGAPSALVAQK